MRHRASVPSLPLLSLLTALSLLSVLSPLGGGPWHASASHYFDDDVHSEEASWDFEFDTQGWGNSTSEERQAELHVRAGELQGNVVGPHPHFDSPVFNIVADNLGDLIEARHYIVLRMRYSGNCQRGRWLVRKGLSTLPDDQQQLPRDNPVWQDLAPITGGALALDFEVFNDGEWHVYYAPLWQHYKGNITQLRLLPVVETASAGQPSIGNTFSIDFIKIAKAPTIMKVEGCINRNWAGPTGTYNATVGHASVVHTRDFSGLYNETHHLATNYVHTVHVDSVYNVPTLQYVQTIDSQTTRSDLPYSRTYNCLPEGGELITITGTNFGVWDGAADSVLIGGIPCRDVRMTVPEMQIQCITPAGLGLDATKRSAGTDLPVRLTNGRLPGLYDVQTYFSYAISTPAIATPNVSNIASTSLDLSWAGPSDYWDAISVTGYSVKIERLDNIPCYLAASRGLQVKDVQYPDLYYVELGNVTMTTLINLIAGCAYTFSIATLTEDQDVTPCTVGDLCRSGESPVRTRTSRAWQKLDLYGRRPRVPGARISAYSDRTNEVRLRSYDFYFTTFNANSTLNHSSVDKRSQRGPTGSIGGEGHYGLNLVGDTNLQNCNASYACCDGFKGSSLDPTTGQRTTIGCTLVCSSIRQVKVPESYLLGEQSRNITSNVLGEGIVIGLPSLLDHNATAKCGGSLRLTAPFARLSGAAWYPREMNIREGFVTTFRFRITEPSTVCDFMDDVYTNCRSRGADGFAFVIQAESPVALGAAGMQLGYGGMRDSVAIEFDTRYSYELFDPYENHISVHSRGWRDRNSANHTFSFGSTVAISDLTDGDHDVRIVYDPVFDEALLSSGDAFTAVSSGCSAVWVVGVLRSRSYLSLSLSLSLSLCIYHCYSLNSHPT
jgi:hypothetical protein